MKKIVSILVCAAFCCFAFAGCGNTVKDTENNCVVAIYDGGYGSEAFKKIGQKFNEHYADEGLTVTFKPADPNLTNASTLSQLSAGPKVTTTDLFLPGNANFRYMVDQGSKLVSGYDCGLEDLTDLLNQKVYGENKTFGEKVDPQFLDNCAIEKNGTTKYYTLPYMGGTSGIAYDAKLFEDNGWEVPRTTDELIALTKQIKADKCVPFVWTSGSGYWDYAVYAWWRQLVTDEECDDFWNCIEDGEESIEVFHNSPKQYRAFKILEDLIYDTSNSHADCMTLDHIRAQIALYTKSNKVAMMPTGDWLENEMKIAGYSSDDIGLMKVPVASDVLKVFTFSTIPDDATLSAVVAAVDDPVNNPKPAGVSDGDFDRIKKIRSYTVSNGFLFNAIIPSYANAKDVAKKFLLYLASDEAQQIFYDETHALLPFSAENLVTPENPTRLQQAVLDRIGTTTYITNQMSKNPIFYNNGLNSWMDNIESYIGTTDKNDKKTALEFQQMNYEHYKTMLNGKL